MKNSKRFLIAAAILTSAAAVTLMVVIFCLSSQPAVESDKLSDGFLEGLVRNWLARIIPMTEEKITSVCGRFSNAIRKAAHFVEYALLGLLLQFFVESCAAIRRKDTASSKGGQTRNGNFLRMILVVLFCALYASSDEIHQLFVEGRGGRVADVLLDTAGSLTGVLSAAGCIRLFKHRK